MFKETKKCCPRTNYISWYIPLLFIAISFISVDIAAAGQDKSAIGRRAAKRNFSRGPKVARSSVAPTTASAVKNSKSKRSRRSGRTDARPRTLRQKFSEVEILLSDDFTLADASSLPRAPGSNLTVLSDPMRVGVQLPISEIKTLVEQGTEVTKLRNFVLVEGFANKTNIMGTKAIAAASTPAPSVSGNNGLDADIPSNGDWTYSPIYFWDVTGGETVTSIDVYCDIESSWSGYVFAEFSDEDYNIYNYPLIDADSGSISYGENGITAFNGKDVDQVWYLWARENFADGTGYIDFWSIKLYYGEATSPCEIHGFKFDDADGDSIWDLNEEGLGNWEFYLDLNSNGQYDISEPNAISDPNGHYGFYDIEPGTYKIREIPKAGWTQTLPGGNEEILITTESDQIYLDNNFGNTTLQIGGYCDASAAGNYEYISRVQVGTIDNSSSNSEGYHDYTAISTAMVIGGGHLVTVTNGAPWPSDECGIWVDWNQDMDFDDAGETITVSGNPGGGPYTATIVPPAGASLGDTRMRIRIIDSDSDSLDPCGRLLYGEAEDYTVTVISAPATVKISGYAKTSGGVAIPGVLMSASSGQSDTTNANGYYEVVLPSNPWTGSITPSKDLWFFNLSVHNYLNVTSNISNENFTGTYTADTTPTISGYVKTSEEYDIKDVTITASTGENTTTDNDGYYQLTVSTPGPIPVPWQGTITAAKDYWSFEPVAHPLADVIADTPDVDFTGAYTEDPTPTISGYVRTSTGEGVEGVLLYADGAGGSALTDVNGYYELTVPDIVRPATTPWTGIVTPCKTDWFFDPINVTYTDLHADISGQDHVATYLGNGCGSGWIEEWVTRYHGNELELFTDGAQDIAVDDLGNIYVTGSSYSKPDPSINGNYDYATVKYDSNGNQLWVTKYNGPDNNGDGGGGFTGTMFMAVDSFGNVYVTGYSRSEDTYNDYATVKYDTDGNEMWVARYDGPGNRYDEPSDIAVDNTGNVYVTGNSEGVDGNDDYATIKYDPNGVELWVARYDGNGDEQDFVKAIAVDDFGNVYVTGHSDSQGNDIYDGHSTTIKYNSEGVELWVAMHNDPENLSSGASDIAIDDMGNIYVTGGRENSENNTDFLTIRYDPNGTEDWVTQWNDPDDGDEGAKKIALDNFGNLYVSGQITSSGIAPDFMTIKYDSESGQLIWAARQNGPEDLYDSVSDMAIDEYGNVYVTGISDYLYQVYPNVSTANYMTVKYTPDNNVPAWIAKYEGLPDGLEIAAAIAIDNSNNVYVTGDSYAYTTIKYSQCPISVDLVLDRTWMYQNLPGGQTGSNLTADVSIVDDPSSNSSYTYQWEIILPSDVTVEPSTVSGAGTGDPYWTFAAPNCNESAGISDSGQTFTVKVTVIGDNFGNVGSAQMEFAIALLGDVDNNGIVDVGDRSITNAFWRNGSAGSFTLRDCDVDCNGTVDVGDRSITNAIWRGTLGSNSITNPCSLR